MPGLTSIKYMPHDVVEYICEGLPLRVVSNSTLMTSIFPLALQEASRKEKYPWLMLSNIVFYPGGLLQRMPVMGTGISPCQSVARPT